MSKSPLLIKVILVFCSIFLYSCNSFFYQRNLYVPVKAKDLKMEYNSIKELDSMKNIKRYEFSTAAFKDTILRRNQTIVNKINAINKTNEVNEIDPRTKFDRKLYTIQEINNGKYVRTYFNRDVNQNFIAYKKKEVSIAEMILYGLGVTVITAILVTIVSIIISFVILFAIFYPLISD